INFRSKGKYIVNDIANELGGGGHVFAAGALVNGNLNDVSRKVVKITAASVQEKMKGN
ncbi:MAG: phosphoesterase, partial [Candidatus Marinimicrobia bacterium]|nr:phosphoesterase [Candidatus Neomarinimicrobiota bacterium]